MAVIPGTRLTLSLADPASAGLDPERIDRLYRLIEGHIAEERYPGAQVAFARHGKLLQFRTFGRGRLDPTPRAATDESLWLLYSQTKVVTAAAIQVLVERGALSVGDRIADHVPEFARKSKGEITLFKVLTHQAGFPSANVTADAWADHEVLRRQICDFELEWWPGFEGALPRRHRALDGGGADRERSGLSSTYLTNGRSDEPWHTQRLDRISTLAHAALIEP